MMKAIASLFLFVLLLPGGVLAGDAPVNIRLSTQNPPGAPTIQTLVHFKERVEAASNGSIKIEIYDSAKLYSDDGIAQAVTSGAVEMGYVNLARYASTIPAADIFQLPFLFNSETILSAARAPGSEIRTLIEKAVSAEAGSRVLWWVSQGQMVFLSHNGSVGNPDHFVGKTVRAAGPVSEAVITQCGGKPKDVTLTEVPQIYERREIDVGMHGVVTVASLKLWTVFDTVTRTNHASAQYVVAINDKFWQRLSGQQQAILTEAAHAADIEAVNQIASIEANAYKQIAENGGAKVTGLSDEELMLWRICSSDVLTEFLERAGENGQQLLTAYGRLRQQPCCNQRSSFDMPALNKH
jgi:C4-dicarboxylate-binding protein DctP